MKAVVINSGCRLNQYESDALETGLRELQFHIPDNPEDADIVILNTCTVTNKADSGTRQLIRRLRRENPASRIVVTGCYATTDKNALLEMPEVDEVIANPQKSSLPSLLAGLTTSNDSFSYPVQKRRVRSRAYLKIQDGCNKQCSYCKIPQARGQAVSRPAAGIIAELEQLLLLGYSEIILTGVNIGSYRFGGLRFSGLLQQLAAVPGDFFLRIGSIEPPHLTPEILSLLVTGKLAPFFHIPLQSGSAEILKKMKRGYTLSRFASIVAAIRRELPLSHIGTDLITGFPSETREHHRETIQFLSEMQFANIHLFPYSRRTGTVSDEKIRKGIWKEVPASAIKEQMRELQQLAVQSAENYVKASSGREWRGVAEECENDNQTIISENYVQIGLPCNPDLAGKLLTVSYNAEGKLMALRPWRSAAT